MSTVTSVRELTIDTYSQAFSHFKKTGGLKLDTWAQNPSSVSFKWEQCLQKVNEATRNIFLGCFIMSAIVVIATITAIVTVLTDKNYPWIGVIFLILYSLWKTKDAYDFFISMRSHFNVHTALKDYLELIKQTKPNLEAIKAVKKSIGDLDLTATCFQKTLQSPFLKTLYPNEYCQNLWETINAAAQIFHIPTTPNPTHEELFAITKDLTIALGKIFIELTMFAAKKHISPELPATHEILLDMPTSLSEAYLSTRNKQLRILTETYYTTRLKLLRQSDDNTYIHYGLVGLDLMDTPTNNTSTNNLFDLFQSSFLVHPLTDDLNKITPNLDATLSVGKEELSKLIKNAFITLTNVKKLL